MGIPETGYGSWESYRERKALLKDIHVTGGVHCEHGNNEETGACQHLAAWADMNGDAIGTTTPTDDARAARG